jgi:hypothetical protein
MSINDPDSDPPVRLTYAEFVAALKRMGWTSESAIHAEWLYFSDDNTQPVYSDDLRW